MRNRLVLPGVPKGTPAVTTMVSPGWAKPSSLAMAQARSLMPITSDTSSHCTACTPQASGRRRAVDCCGVMPMIGEVDNSRANQILEALLDGISRTGADIIILDITDRKRAEAALRESEERQAFLLRLSDALRPLDAAAEIQGEATRLLREHLAAGWCYYVEWDEAAGRGVVLRDATRDGLPSLAGTHDVSDLPAFLVIADVATVERLADDTGDRILWWADADLAPGTTLAGARRTAREIERLRIRTAQHRAVGYDVRPAGQVDGLVVPDGAYLNPAEGWVDLPSLIRHLADRLTAAGGRVITGAGLARPVIERYLRSPDEIAAAAEAVARQAAG